MLQNQTFKFIFVQLRKYWLETLAGTVLLIATNAIWYFITIKINGTVDLLVKNKIGLSNSFWWALGIIGVAALLMAFIRTSSRIVLFGIGRQVESDQRTAFYNHLLKLDLLYFNTQKIGDLISRSTSDIQAIRQMMGFGILNIINIVWVYAFTLPLMLKLNAQITFWILIGYLPILAFVRYLSLKLKTDQQLAQEKLGALSSFIEEDINGIQVIKAYSQEEREIERFKIINDSYLNTATSLAQWRGLIWPIMEFAGRISFFVLVFYINQGKISAGQIAAFLLCLERLVFPTAIIGWLITIFQRGSVSVQRIQEVFQENPQIKEIPQAKALKVDKGEIEIKDLSFKYEAKSDNILQNLSLKLEPKQFIGVVGLIGSGKSTLCSALLRLIDIPENCIFIDGQDITKISIGSLREQISLIPQETFLFNSTISDNIGFAGNYTQAEIESAAKLAQIHPEIINFKEAYQTMVGEKGVSVSGGQAQRIALARALITKPKVLILDDSIASVDNEIGLQILNAVRQEFQDLTLVLITHRISSLKDADQIFVIDKGSCVGHGKHSNLLRHNIIYKKLWKKQKLASEI